jgi:hypothetical protein
MGDGNEGKEQNIESVSWKTIYTRIHSFFTIHNARTIFDGSDDGWSEGVREG